MNSEEMELYRWFLSLALSNLPSTPFELKPAAIIVDVERWYNATRLEVKSALNCEHAPRRRFGALQADLTRLKGKIVKKS